MYLFVSDDGQTQELFWPKRTKNKMSSVMPFSFNAVELSIVTINEKPWTRAREVCKALRYEKKTVNIVKNISERKTTPRSINWEVYSLQAHLWIDLRAHKISTFTSMKKWCMSCYFQVNSHRQETSEDTASLYCFLMFGSSLVISHMRWKLKVLQVVFRPLRLQMKIKIWHLHCSMMIYKIVTTK